jgi:mannose-1-phosphate guanylyltransferase
LSDTIIPIVLAGGSGKRFWPLSREARPKQFLKLLSDHTLIADTVARVSLPEASPALVVSAAHQAPLVGEALEGLPHDLLLEPATRNTAPAVALALAWLRSKGDDPIIGLFPSDHYIPNIQDFHRHFRACVEFARETDRIVTLGLLPSHPETGYGYIHQSEVELAATHGLPFLEVKAFVEKPSLDVAVGYLAEGEHLWNSGMFVSRAGRLQEEIARYLPEIHAGVEEIAASFGQPEGPSVLSRIFPNLPSISLDYGVMERTAHIGVVPARFQWSDVGSWNALLPFADNDRGVFIRGEDVIELGCKDVVVLRGGRRGGLLALCEVENVGVVETDDVTLVLNLEKAQDVRRILARLEGDDATRSYL